MLDAPKKEKAFLQGAYDLSSSMASNKLLRSNLVVQGGTTSARSSASAAERGPYPTRGLRDERDWAGVSTFKIRQQIGHASHSMLSRYVRDGELFLANAASILL